MYAVAASNEQNFRAITVSCPPAETGDTDPWREPPAAFDDPPSIAEAAPDDVEV